MKVFVFFISESEVQRCPTNVVPGDGLCALTCEDPHCVTGCGYTLTCVCDDGYYINGEGCIIEEECGCYLSAADEIIAV